ncbi:uncharacterized protein FOMMEDRAFT_135199 [Fomitiporia mediterranea MF3/22]|uniref:uncharacterized protein n=1 Tax=Fomitiporia mediterranea (strain MF3/22) TaxID=694068 RepID=UPI000440767F|nr:uncharacterized protein FOMMEDRAFT_135199 [Fomitiporia mediterranea MF3/22]EJD00913.1 hypothetical protein FOMMEDRAFT_135199 [Fomitiporia mediterranea MF3/22]
MDKEVAQLVEMGAIAAQARAALKKYKDVMRAAEKIFDGEFEDVMDDDVQELGIVERPTGRPERVRMITPDEDNSDAEDGSDMDPDDGYEEDEYVDYDSDYGDPPVASSASADPYAGIFFSKDRKEEVIEVEEEPEVAVVPDQPEPLKLLTQGQWMKGCPEGSEQSFLFGIYSGLSEGVCACPEACGFTILRKKANFFAIYPDFSQYIDHLKKIVQQKCPKCSSTFCFACGERSTSAKDANGKATANDDPLFHCSNLQGVILGVGLLMLEQIFAEQIGDTSFAVVRSGNSKKRKVTTPSTPAPDPDDEDDSYCISSTKGKKSKAGGIGYAGSNREDHSGQAQALAAQNKKDQKIGNLLKSVREFLPNQHRGKTSDFLPHPTTLAHLRRRFNYVSSTLLRNDSLSDMSDRNVLYFELFEWLETISNHESLASMMAMPIMVVSSIKAVNTKKVGSRSQIRERTIIYEGSSGPRELLEAIVIQATAALKGLEGPKLSDLTPEEMTEEQKRMTGVDVNGKGKEKAPASNGADSAALLENKRLLEFCNRIIATAAAIDRSLLDTKGYEFLQRLKASLPKVPTSDNDSANAAAVRRELNPGMTDEELQTLYVKWATRVRFVYCNLTLPAPDDAKFDADYSPSFKHAFSQDARLLSNADMPKRAVAIAKELAVLTTNLPVAWDSSVFVRVDEGRVDVIKALIVGPEGTPYLFDIFLGSSYNQTPPSVKYMTTNDGKYRFNPNLYSDGKVCLSLLGTWSGPSWVSGKSTLLQVLISIQSMILCDEPYLNEPGWASQQGTPQSKAYSANVRRMVVHTAMLGNLKNPPDPFADVIRTHFRLKARSITAQLDEWLAEDDARQTALDGATTFSKLTQHVNNTASGSGNHFKRDVDELKALLVKLQTEGAPSSSSA